MDDNMNNNNVDNQPQGGNENGVNWDSQSNNENSGFGSSYPVDPFDDGQKPKKKTPVLAVCAAGVVAACAVGVAGACVVTHKNPVELVKDAATDVAEKITGKSFDTPEEQLQKSLENTKAVLESRRFISSGLNDLAENGKITANVGLSVKSMPAYPAIEGAGMDVTINSDYPNKTANLNVSGSYHGISLDAINVYSDGTEVLAGVPMVTDKYVLSFDLDDIEEQLQNSPLFSEYFNDSYNEEEFSEMAALTDISKEMQSEFPQLISDNYAVLCESVVYEAKEDKADKDGHDAAIEVTIPADALEAFLSDSLNDIVDSNSFNDYINEIAELEGADVDSAKEEINNGIDEFLSKVEFEDATGIFYIDDDIITDSEVEAEIKIDGESGVITLDAGLNDDVFEADFKFAVDENFIKVTYSDEDKDGVRTIDASLKSSNSDSTVISYSCEYDSNSGDISGKFDFAGAAAIDYSGTLESSDNVFDLDISSVKMSAYGQDMGEFGFNIKVEPLDGEIKKPEGEPVRIFEVTEDELEDIASDLQSDLINFYSKYSGLLG